MLLFRLIKKEDGQKTIMSIQLFLLYMGAFS